MGGSCCLPCLYLAFPGIPCGKDFPSVIEIKGNRSAPANSYHISSEKDSRRNEIPVEGSCLWDSLFAIIWPNPCLMTFSKQNCGEPKGTSLYIDVLLILIHASCCSTFDAFWLLAVWTFAPRQFNHDWFNCANPINKSGPSPPGGIMLAFLWVCLQSPFTHVRTTVFSTCSCLQGNLPPYRKGILQALLPKRNALFNWL